MCQNTLDKIRDSAAKKSRNTNSNDTSTVPSPTPSLDSNDYYPFPNEDVISNTTALTKPHYEEQQLTTTRKVIYTMLWLILTYLSKEFAKFLSIYQSQAATKTFIFASYQYDAENTHFDNTFLTYGTDFLISILMAYASYKCYSTHIPLGYKGSALFASYAISVFSGGYAHSTFTSEDIDSMNTLKFRVIWIICVGTVTAAGGFMGMCGSEIAIFFDRLQQQQQNQQQQQSSSSPVLEKRFPVGHIISNSLWWIYGIFMTTICTMGEISYKRPACDIFVAGTTQFVPTFYCELILLSIRWADAIPLWEGETRTSTYKKTSLIPRNIRILFYVGFVLNAPLLPSYPLLVQYTNLSLGVVNALMHLNLTYSWGMQAWSTYQICLIMMKEEESREELKKKTL